MYPHLTLDRQIVTTLRDQVLHVLIELTAPQPPTTDRPALDLVVVIDRSGSMAGAPLHSVTEAVAQLLRLAGPDDRLSVITFDTQAQTLLPLDHHDAESAGRRIRAIAPGGSTNLSAGWLKALDQLVTGRRPDALRRILVLTDGQVNVGITEGGALATMVAGGVAQGITTSCIGFGDHFDEQLLSTLADAGLGNDYWCADSDQAMAVFGSEFSGLASVVAQNMTVVVHAEAVVATVEMLQDLPSVRLPDGGTEVTLGDAYGNETRRVVVAFHLRPVAHDGPVNVGEVELRWAAVTGDVALHSVTLPIIVDAAQARGDGSEIVLDPRVTEHVVRLRADQERRRARLAWDSGDHSTALGAMDSAAAFLRSSEGISGVERDRLADEIAMMSSGTFDSTSGKRMHSAMRSRAKGRNLEFERQATSVEPNPVDPDLEDPNR